MERSIIIVNAVQLITSESNPQGILSTVSGFPQIFDSGTTGNVEQNMRTARSVYYDQLSKNYANTNPNRVMTTVTLEIANGRQVLSESVGALPEIEPEPENV